MKDNKLIAEFMGYICSGDDEYLIHPETNYDHSINDEDWFLYSTSWDWLMPVVEKIESDERYDVDILQYGTRIRENQKEIVNNIANISFDKKIEHTYDAVVEFINQYNNLDIGIMKDNKLIAEFMGYEIIYRPNSNGFIEISDTELCDVDDLEYHKSWDWLMPVVEKIECTKTDDEDNSDSFFNVMIEVFECNINGRDICICENGNTKLEATYRAVVKFINQYNK